MKYTEKRFTVPAIDKSPPDCRHGWIGQNGRCVLCGERRIGLLAIVNDGPQLDGLASYNDVVKLFGAPLDAEDHVDSLGYGE